MTTAGTLAGIAAAGAILAVVGGHNTKKVD